MSQTLTITIPAGHVVMRGGMPVRLVADTVVQVDVCEESIRLVLGLNQVSQPGRTPMDALERAIRHAGGPGRLADRVDVPTNAPCTWRIRKRVPAEYCPAIERETGVRCEDLRPDVAWDVLRMQSGAEPVVQGA